MRYTGIGSRSTPKEVLAQMEEFANLAARRSWVLRSGAAAGADSAFELGCDNFRGLKEIYLPWANFNNNTSSYTTPTERAHQLASNIHPVYSRLTDVAKLLVARNMHQILGYELILPSLMVVCWTPDGIESAKDYSSQTGGTGSAIALASRHNIPVFNLKNENRYAEAIEFLLDPFKEQVLEL